MHARISVITLFSILLFLFFQNRSTYTVDTSFTSNVVHISNNSKWKTKDLIVTILLFITITFSVLLHIQHSSTLKTPIWSTIQWLNSPKSILQQSLIWSPNSLLSTTQQPTTYIWTGQIVDLQREGRYTIETPTGQYLLSSSKRLALGDIVWISWRITYAKQLSIEKKFKNFLPSLPAIFTWWFDYPQRMMMKWVRGDILSSKLTTIEWDTKLPRNLAFRKEILVFIEHTFWTTRAGWLFQWMLIGDRSWIPKTQYQQFISSGLVHIVAVSGSNILYVVLFCNIALFFIPYYIRVFVVLGVIVFYALICGLDSSILRAVIMWWLSLFSLVWWRVVSSRRLLQIARISMLIWNPRFLLFDLGFVLSFGAIVWILLINDLYTHITSIENKNIFSKVIKNYILPSVWAWRWVAPVLIFFTGTTNLLSIVASILVVPFVPIILLRWVIAVFLDNIFSIEKYIDIVNFPFERLYWLAWRLTSHGLYLSTSYWRIRHVIVAVIIISSSIFFKIITYFHLQKTNSRVPGLEPELAASETDVLPLTPHPY